MSAQLMQAYVNSWFSGLPPIHSLEAVSTEHGVELFHEGQPVAMFCDGKIFLAREYR